MGTKHHHRANHVHNTHTCTHFHVVALRTLIAWNASVTLQPKQTQSLHTQCTHTYYHSTGVSGYEYDYTPSTYIYIHIPSIPSTDIIILNIPLSVIIETLGEDGLHILGQFHISSPETHSSHPS